jgi:hypothetical protein
VAGENLRQLLHRRGRLSPAEALQILEPTCSALQAAHAAGVIHRDLKASNIAVGTPERLQVKLLDFGIAKLTQADPSQPALTVRGSRLGTPYAMAPEQIRGDQVDARADVYALGVLLFQMLTGGYPFTAATAQEIERLHLEAPPPHPGQHAPISPALEAVVLRCLEKPPEARYSSVGELLAAFRDALFSEAPAEAAEERPAIAILLELAATPDADADDLIDDTAAIMDLAEAALRAGGFELPLQTGNVILGAKLASEQTSRTERQSALDLARALLRQVAARPEARPELTVTVAMQAGRVQLRGAEITGGDLLRTSEWKLAAERDGVRLSATAAADLV